LLIFLLPKDVKIIGLFRVLTQQGKLTLLTFPKSVQPDKMSDNKRALRCLCCALSSKMVKAHMTMEKMS